MSSSPVLRPGWWMAALLLTALGGVPGAGQAQTFDRLFTTASERARLDEAREAFRAPAPEPAPVTVVETATEEGPTGPVISQIRVSGLVIRGRGQDTSWINGEQIQPDETTPEGIRVRPQDKPQSAVRITLPETAEPLVLRPGQKIDLATGQVLDDFETAAPEGAENVLEGLTKAAEKPTATGAADTEPVAAGGG